MRELKWNLVKVGWDKRNRGTQSKGRENKSALTLMSHETSKPAHIGHFFHPSVIRLPSKEDIFLKEDICFLPGFFSTSHCTNLSRLPFNAYSSVNRITKESLDKSLNIPPHFFSQVQFTIYLSFPFKNSQSFSYL